MGGRDGRTWSFSVSEGIGDSPVKQKEANGQKTFLIKHRERTVSLAIIEVERSLTGWRVIQFGKVESKW